MHAFVPVPGGFASRLADAERTVLARVVADVAELLGARPDAADGATTDPGTPRARTPDSGTPEPDEGESGGDDALLAALDFTPAADVLPDAPADPALARLLPPMSHDDPALAAELRSLTEDAVRGGKLARLTDVWRELSRTSGPGSAVVVHAGAEGAWLAALTDVRLVLASRLGIDDAAAAEAVHDRAQRAGRPDRTDHAEGAAEDSAEDAAEAVTDALATLYAAVTWWQESLLAAMQGGRSGQ